jgi:hypothetical protein
MTDTVTTMTGTACVVGSFRADSGNGYPSLVNDVLIVLSARAIGATVFAIIPG